MSASTRFRDIFEVGRHHGVCGSLANFLSAAGQGVIDNPFADRFGERQPQLTLR